MDNTKPGLGTEADLRSPVPVDQTEAPAPQNVMRDAGQDATRAAASSANFSAEIRETATTATRAVKQQASEFAADIGDELGKTVETQKVRGAEAIQSFARAISSAASELEGSSPKVARSVRAAARKVDGLSVNLRSHSVDDLMREATDLARSQPLLFIGGAVAAGFALSRFVKSSARHPTSDAGETLPPSQG